MTYCFPVTALEGAEFSAVQFLEECHSRNPIANVHRDLVAFKRSLETQLVAIIDKDYAEFLQLSLKLKGVNNAVDSIREPLQLILQRVNAVQEAAIKMLQQNQDYIDQLGQMEQKKKELTLAIIICEKLDLAERLLNITEDKDDEESENEMENVFIPVYDEEQSILLERVARLVLEIECQIAQGAEAEEHRLSVIERILREKLEAELATEIVPDTFYSREHIINVKNVNNLLRAYVIIQEPAIPEDMVARLLVQPFQDAVMTRSRLDGNTRGSCEGLPGIYSAVIEFVRKQLSGIVALPVCDASRKKNAIDILGQSIWKSIYSTLTEKLSEIFVAYNPDRIYHNYTHSVKFVAALEEFCSNKASKECFRELTLPFLEKWNMDVYFQLRYSELTQTMQSKRPQDTVFLQESISDYVFPMSKQIALASMKCFADGVHLDAQTPKFARLSLQLLHEYVDYWRTP
ncbi:oligomeric Golgi complex subunit, partial [Thraustotheca clavata]